jgi:hypothetical protein
VYDLRRKNIDIQTVKRYKKLEEELKKYGVSMESMCTLVSILQMIKELGYNPHKIVKELARIKSLRQTDKCLKNNCKILESSTTRYQEIAYLCEQLISVGIGFAQLSAFHSAVFKKIDVENLSYGEASYALMDRIDTSEKLLDARKHLNDTWIQIQTVNVFWERQMDALNALMRLQSYGVTNEEILNIHESVKSARLENARRI